MNSLLGKFEISRKSIRCVLMSQIAEFELFDNSIPVSVFKEVEAEIIEKTGQTKYYSVIKTSDYTKLNTELKEYLISEDRSWVIYAEAILNKGLAKKLMNDLYFQLNLPLVPTKTFVNSKDAKDWIESLKPIRAASGF